MLERWSRPLAGFGDWLANVMNGFYRLLGAPTGPGKLLQDFLNGSWLGHPLHPVVTDVAVGGFTVLIVLDLLALFFGVDGLETASTLTLGLSTLAAISAIVTGLTDYKDTATGDERSVTTLHGLTNIVGTVIYAVAFFMRLGVTTDAGRIVSIFAYLVISFGAFIGGHVVFKYGYMVNRNAFARGRRAKEFTPVLPAASLPDATPTKASLGPTTLVLVRRGDVVHALKETCSHAGGPLSEGELRGDSIVCPWHFSHFRLSDGAVDHGPATTRQVAYRARINGDQVEVQGPIEA
jgi:nitrite reductase/ring-hydroxylating ferredoxin subunit/uncharacterized membrane protein